MRLDIVTPDKNLFAGDVDYIFCPGTHGSFGILNNHAPIIATLKKGNVRIRIASTDSIRFDKEAGKQVEGSKIGEEISFEISGGVIEVQNNKAILLAE